MAQPSSSHHRERERSHHHHRTISSTTLLLVLSLILAVLAVMLSLPNTQGSSNGETPSSGVWNYLSPKRSQALVAREHAVAQREAEVARREAELLAGTPGGVALSCPPASSSTPVSPQVFIETPPVHTVIKEVVKEVEALSAPSWWRDAPNRIEELLDREAKVSEREKDVGRREENIGRRETDVSRRETWIMEQLIALGNERSETVEEEIIYDTSPPRRKPKELPPIISITETQTRTVTQTLPPVTQFEIETKTETVTVPPAAHTRVAARPAPEEHLRKDPATQKIRPTTAVEVVKEEVVVPTAQVIEEVEEISEEDYDEPVERTVTVVKRPKQTRRPKRTSWFGGSW